MGARLAPRDLRAVGAPRTSRVGRLAPSTSVSPEPCPGAMLGAAVKRQRRPLVLVAGLIAVLLAVSVAGPASAAPAPVDPELATKLQARLDRWRVNHRAPGVAAAVRLPDGSRWVGTSGTRTTGKQAKPVGPATPFAVASLTKTFMAALILQLREEEKLWLGTKLSTWLPDYPKAKQITVKMLLNHRSGIFDYFAHPRYEQRVFGRPSHRWRTAEILRLTGPRYCAPGKCYRYSNTNYVLLGKIVRKVTGKTAAQNIRERFLEPLGLTDTYFQGQERIGKEPAKGYWATARGLARFLRWLALPAQHVRRHRRQCCGRTGLVGARHLRLAGCAPGRRGAAALVAGADAELPSGQRLRAGDALRAPRRPLGIGHGGSLRGFVSLMYRLPGEDLDVVVLTNLGRTNIQTLADKLTRATLNHLEPDPEPSPLRNRRTCRALPGWSPGQHLGSRVLRAMRRLVSPPWRLRAFGLLSRSAHRIGHDVGRTGPGPFRG